MDWVFAVGIAIVVVTIIVVATASAKKRRRNVLAQLAATLEHGVPDVERSHVTGKRGGLDVTYRFVDRGAGSNSEPWTEVDIAIPRDYPLSLRIVRGKPNAGDLAAGRAVDIEIGNAWFDENFIVEAAPSDVVRELIDDGARRFLDSYKQPELTTEESGTLRFAVPSWIEEVAPATSLIDGVSAIAARIRDAYAAANSAVPQGEAGSPYRPQADDRPMRDVEAKRDAELAALQDVKHRRAQKQERDQVIIFVGALVFIAAMFLLAFR